MKITRNHEHESGGALLFCVVILLAVSSVGVGLIELTYSNNLDVARRKQYSQALWAAEAGLQHAQLKLSQSQAYRDNPILFTNILEFGSFGYQITAHDHGDDTYSITSRAFSANTDITRTLTQTYSVDTAWGGAFDYAFYSEDGPIEIKNDVTITGDIYTSDGDIEFGTDSSIDGNAWATNGSVSPEDIGDGDPYPTPAPAMPTLDTSYYDALITDAENTGNGDHTFASMNIHNSTQYVEKAATLDSDILISGTGTIVCGEDMLLDSNVILTDRVTLICGKVMELKENVHVYENCIMFAREGIEMKNSGFVMEGGAMLSPGKIELKEGITFNGLLYTEDNIEIKENMTIRGTVISEGKIEVKDEASVTWDPSVFPEEMPHGLSGGSGATNATVERIGNWQEL